MPSLRILYDVDGWAFHNRALALLKHAPPDFTVSLGALHRPGGTSAALGDTPADVVFCLPESRARGVRDELRARGWPSKLVGGWNTGWPHLLATFYEDLSVADAVIINNRRNWEATGKLPRTYMIPNGVDLDVFRVTVPVQSRRSRVLWTGSEIYRGRKGYDRLVVPLAARLGTMGIDSDLLLVDSFGTRKLSPAQMAAWYNTGTVLVCASDAEGTPNPALEAAACGCAVVSTPVGNMPELIRDGVNGYLVDRSLDALLTGVTAACENYIPLSGQMQQDIQAWSWKDRGAEFFRVFREVLDTTPELRAPRRDLSAAVTVFVTTVGAPSFEACLRHMNTQDCTFRLEIIDRVAPMNAAFQRMLDTCATPYFVQVDEDMLLYPHAVRTLYEDLSVAAADVAMVVGDLHDAHLGRPIEGVKMFRHDVVRRYPFEAVGEKRRLQQLRSDGYVVARVAGTGTPTAEVVLGLHGTHWTPQSVYERYSTLERRRRNFPSDLQWFEAYHAVLLNLFREEPTEINFYALMGVIAGTLSCAHDFAEFDDDKDYRAYDRLPGFESLRQFLSDRAVETARRRP